jgi:type IV pilus assembly protein PilE
MQHAAFPLSRTCRGFTLIELMITVAIIGILASITLPSYNQYLQRTHRAHAKAALLNVAQWMERAAVATGTYPSTVPAAMLTIEGGQYKNIVVTRTDTSFSLTAEPLVSTNNKCGNLTLNHQGVKGVDSTTGASVAECWNK